MTIENQLKGLILSRYKSIREFSLILDMPYSTIDTILKRGIQKASITNIIKICKELKISTDELANGRIVFSDINKINFKPLNDAESNLILKYRALDERGKKAIDDTLNREYEFANISNLEHTASLVTEQQEQYNSTNLEIEKELTDYRKELEAAQKGLSALQNLDEKENA